VRIVFLLVLVSAAAAATSSAQDVIYVVRHAERADQSPDSSLSSAGDTRAASLARTLRDSGVTHIFTTELKRTAQTAAPSAAALHVTPRALPANDTNAVVAALRRLAPTDRALVVGHSNTVPAILSALGISSAVTIADAEFDNLFVVVPRKDGPPALLRLRY
jgi:broad specificity phosphatase PhoE